MSAARQILDSLVVEVVGAGLKLRGVGFHPITRQERVEWGERHAGADTVFKVFGRFAVSYDFATGYATVIERGHANTSSTYRMPAEELAKICSAGSVNFYPGDILAAMRDWGDQIR